MRKTEEKEVIPYNTWTCPNCTDNPQFDHKEMMIHIQEVHGVDPKTTKGNRRMVMHMDGAKWFRSDYEWTINDLTFHQSVLSKRDKESQMYWE